MRKIYVLLHDAQQLFRQALAALNHYPVSQKRSTTLLYPTALYTESKPELSKSNLSQMQMFTHTNKTFKGFNRWMITLVIMLSVISMPMTKIFGQASILNYAYATNASGTLEDLSTGSTSLLTGVNDDAASAVVPIGFNFQFMGVLYSHFSANSNGQMRFHTSAGATAIGTNTSTLSANTVILAPFAGDNEVGNGLRYKVVGTAPNRKLIVEWNQFYVNFVNITNAGNMQVWVEESTGIITYIYGDIYNSNTSSQTRSIFIASSNTATTAGSITIAAPPTFAASATLATNTIAANTGIGAGGPAAPLIANIGSSAEGARRVFTFTPTGTAPAAPTGMSFTATGFGGYTVNWVDASTDENGFALLKSSDGGVTYTLVTNVTTTTAAGTGTTYSSVQTGLSPGTTYFWKVVALKDGLTSAELSGSASTTSCAGGLSGVKTIPGDYATITAAIAAANASGISASTIFELQSGYSSAGETFPLTFTNIPCNNAGVTLTIRPAAGATGLSISSANTTATVDLNGANWVIFDGRPGGTGTTSQLTIANTSTAGVAVRYINDANNNTITYTTLQGVNTLTTSGVVLFSTTTGANGNDNNTISNSTIRDGATTPANGIYSSGTTTNNTTANSGNTISNNNIFNFFAAGSATAGISLSSGNTDWTISGNSFYQTATRTFTSASSHNGIFINNTSGNNFVITNNFIGGTAASAGGTPWTILGAVANRFVGIQLSVGATTASSVQGNTITNLSFTSTSGTTSLPGIWAGIYLSSGIANIGNVTGNIIGSGTGTGAVAITSSTTGGISVGIGTGTSSTGNITIANNTIGSINVLGSGVAVSQSFNAIWNSSSITGKYTISNNTIGSTSTANSIQYATAGTGTTAAVIQGIVQTASPSNGAIINGNTIANLSSAYIPATANSSTQIRGILASSGIDSISANTIRNLSCAANATGTGTTASVIGLALTSSTSGALIASNSIYALSNTNAGAATAVTGIHLGNATSGRNIVEKNLVYDLSLSSTSASADIRGINLQSGLDTIKNNMVRLGTGVTTGVQIAGIYDVTSTANTAILFNSVYIGGTGVSTQIGNSFALKSDQTTNARIYQNNIFVNARSNAATGGKHYAVKASGTFPNATGLTLNYNIYNATGTGAVLGLAGAADVATFAAWKSTTGADANSQNSDPQYVDPVAATPDLHINVANPTVAEGGGIAVATITEDYDGQTRSGLTPTDIGADAFNGTSPVPSVTINSVTPGTASLCTATARVISVNVTTPAGTITGVTITFNNGTLNSNVAMTNTSGSTWEYTIPAASPTNTTVTWSVTATNSLPLSVTLAGTSYKDEPLFGVTASAAASPAAVCTGGTATLTASLTLAGSGTLGAGASTSSSLGTSMFPGSWGGAKTQYLIRKSELNALGLFAGNITSLAFTPTSGGQAYPSFAISMAHAATTNGTLTAGFVATTDVYAPGTSFTPTLNVANTITFTTPFNWNGNNDIIVSICWSTGLTTSSSATVQTDAVGFNSSYGWQVDSQTPAVVCGTSGVPSGGNTPVLSTSRPKFTFAGNAAPSITSVVWNNSAGSNNPQTVTPSATTVYTPTITAAGCTVTPAGATVTVNPLPTAPGATNSSQCGAGVPTASVSDPNSFTTPTFKWYADNITTTALQTSTATTYTSSVSGTTTFYVSVTNPVTGCESARTPVTVTFSAPPTLVITPASAITFCEGGSVSLDAATGSSPAYVNFAWTPSTALSATNTAVVTANPTTTTTYTVTANDGLPGGCTTTASVTLTVNPNPVVTSVTATPGTVCSGATVNLAAVSAVIGSGTTAIGAGATTSSSSGVSMFSGGWGGVKTQYIILASELTAANVSPGAITSLGFVTSGAAGQQYTGFAVNIGHTTKTAMSFPLISTGLTQVYAGTEGANNGFTPAASAVNTLVFGTGGTASSFVWNGTDNIVVSFCYSTVTGEFNSSSTTILSDAVSFTSSAYGKEDATLPATFCPFVDELDFGTTGTASSRPRFIISGQVINNTSAANTWSWTTTLGGSIAAGSTTTHTPVTSSVTTGTYTATATSGAGCVGSLTSAAITVNPLPDAPIVIPSVQCGIGNAGVAAVGAGIGQYRWYLTATGGTPLAGHTNDTLNNYIISVPTTFYVAINNGTCESNRTSVLADVISPDPITANASSVAACLGDIAGVDLSVTQTGSNQVYSFTWSASPTTGSGLPTPAAGASVTGALNVTPTAAGTYRYTVQAVDGSCTTTSFIDVTINPLPVIDSIKANNVTICEGGSTVLSVYSPAIGAGPQTAPTGYLAATFSNTTEDDIGQVTFGTINNPAVRPTPQTSNSDAANTYTDFTGIAPTTITAGQSYPITVYHFHSTTDASANFSNVYIDFNRDGDFNDAGELTALSKPGGTFLEDFVGTVTVPATASAGLTRMRVVLKEGAISSPTGTIGSWGEAEDYLVNVLGPIAQNPALTYTWDNEAGTGATTSAVSPTVSTLYTVTVTNTVTGCSDTAQVQVNVNPKPNQPTAAGSIQCGAQVPTASVTSNSGAVTPNFNWYTAATGGVPVQTGTTGVTGSVGTYMGVITSSTTLYVSEISEFGCESDREPVQIDVIDPDPITAAVSDFTLCVNSTATLTSSYSPAFNTFSTFTLTVNNQTGSGITNPVDLTPNATGSDGYDITPTLPGTYIYTITAFDPIGCTSTDTVHVVVHSAPAISTFTVTPSPVCEGAAVALTATTTGTGVGNVAIGNGTTLTSATSQPTAFNNRWPSSRMQIVYTAAELQAAGLIAGNITAMTFNISTLGDAATNDNFRVKIGNTALSTLTAFADTTVGFTNVFNPKTYTHTATGLQTITFDAPFNWNGTSNIIVQVCMLGADATNNSQTYYTATAGNTVAYTSTAENNSASLSTNRLNIVFSGLSNNANLTANNTWVFNPGAIAGGTTGSAATVASIATTSYTATATSNDTEGFNCSATSAPVVITVNPTPLAPAATASTQCGIGVPAASVSGGVGTYKWYDAATGGNVIQRGGTTYAGSISATTHFYVSDSSAAGCEGPRVDLLATVTSAPSLVITPGSATTFCEGLSVGLNAATASDPSYVNFTWSTTPLTGAGLSAATGAAITATPTVAGTYTVNLSANDGLLNGCSNTASINITMNATPIITSATATPATSCTGGASSLSALSTLAAVGEVTIGTNNGTAITTTGTPYRTGTTSGTSHRTQYLVRASELTAAGIVAGNINSLGLVVSTAFPTGFMDNLSIRMGSTSATVLSSTYLTAPATVVYTAASYAPVTGVNTHTFQTPFNWDGTSNILIEFCGTLNAAGVGSGTSLETYNAGFVSTVANNTVCNATSGTTTTNTRPVLVFNALAVADVTGSYTYAWTPGPLAGSTVAVNPTTTTSYQVVATNPATSCVSAPSTVTVTVVPLSATATATPAAICIGASSALSATPAGGSSFTYSWKVGATEVSTAASFTVSPTVTTVYDLTITNNCSEVITKQVTVTVNPLPTVTINEAVATICAPATYALTNTTSAASPVYQWIAGTTDISGQTAAGYAVSATGSYKVRVTDGVTGCVNTSAAVSVTVNPQPAVVTITPSATTVCSGGSVNLTVSGGTTGGPATGTIGTATTLTSAISQPTAFNNRWPSSRMQLVYTASELQAAGLQAGNITSIAFNITTLGDAATNANFRVKMGHTALSTLTAFADTTTGFTNVFNPKTYTHAIGLNTITFDNPFVWNGTSNVIVQVCMLGANATNNSQTYYTATTGNTVGYTSTAEGNSASLSANRLNIVFGYNSVQTPTYSWTADPTLSTTTGATTIATPINTTTYTATATQATGCTRQASVTITATPCSPVWTGATSTNWNTASNWSSNVVPSIIENVTIGTAGTGFYPVLTANQTVGGTLTMASGTSITIGSNTLTLNGGVTPISAGVLVGSATSNLSVAGTASLKFASGAGATLKNLTITSGTTTLTSALDITGGTGGINSGTFGTVTVANGATLASAGFLTFKSNASGTARLASGNVTGDVTVERFIPANAKRAYRMLSIPTKGGQKIKAAWQEGGTNANFNPKPGFGTVITSNVGPSATMIANGFDQYSTSTSMQRWNTATGAWVDIAATTGTGTTGNIESLKGYSIYIRGDRTQLNTGTTTTSTTLRTTGTLYIGDQAPISIPANKFEMVGNTYVSAIDFALLTKSNINGTLYLWDPKLPQSNGTLGGYVSFVAINGYTPSLTTGSYATANSIIESGQSFFVATGANPGTLTLTEAAKVTGSRSDVFRPTTAPKKLKANLYVVAADNSTLMADANVSVFDNPYSNAVDGDDGLKLSNAGENLAIFRDNKNLVVEGRQPVAESDTTYFNMWNMSASRQYRLELVAEQMDVPGLSAYLVDNYLGTTTPLNMSGAIAYDFGISSSAPLSSATNRFKVVYRQVQLAPLPVTFVSISANKLGAAVKVDWKVAAERGIVRYEVERSANGSRFINAGNVTATGNSSLDLTYATGNSSLDLTYSWMDATPLSGTNFYRIKSIGVAGDVKYTNIAKVTFGDVKPSYTIAPNPVEGSTVNLQFKNRVAGRYNVRLLSNAGQVIFTTIAEHAGGNSTQLISLPATIARGAYQIEIIAPDKTTEVQNLFINTTK